MYLAKKQLLVQHMLTWYTITLHCDWQLFVGNDKRRLGACLQCGLKESVGGTLTGGGCGSSVKWEALSNASGLIGLTQQPIVNWLGPGITNKMSSPPIAPYACQWSSPSLSLSLSLSLSPSLHVPCIRTWGDICNLYSCAFTVASRTPLCTGIYIYVYVYSSTSPCCSRDGWVQRS